MRAKVPLRLRLTLAFGLGMAVVLALLGGFLYVRLGTELMQGIDLGLRSRAAVIISAIGNSNHLPIHSGGHLIDPDEAFAQVLNERGRIVDTSPAVARAPMLSAHEIRAVSGPTFVSRRVTGVDDPARLLAVPVHDHGRDVVVVVGAPLGDRHDALDRLLLLLGIGGPVALLLSSALGWVVAGAGLRPVERIRREAGAISVSEPDRRLPVPLTGDELSRLAETLNAMLDRLQEALEREHRFVNEASHELRSPLTVLKAELDLALARPRSTAELESTVRLASAETDRLVRFAEDLLVLARTSHGRMPLRREDVPLRALLEEIARPLRARAEDAGARIEVCAPDEQVRVDPVRIRQAVHNLVDNAIGYGTGSPVIRVIASTDNGRVRIVVEDSGPGFASAVLDRAFEPFARGSAAEYGDGGAGLGLVIVKAVAEAHGGTAVATNTETGGARVTLTLGPVSADRAGLRH